MKHAGFAADASGFTMLEVLIAIVVVAFGLLGLAGLQVFALKNNQSASLRVAATNLTMDIVDRMKANYLGVINGSYNQPSTAAYTAFAPACTQNVGCPFNTMAGNDIAQWQQRLAATLPGGVGVICLDSTPDEAATPANPMCDGNGTASYAVKIWWYDRPNDPNAASTLKYIYTSFNP